MKPEITLIPYYPCEEITLPWYQDVQLVKQVDNKEEPYTVELLKRMYEYLDAHGALFYIAYNGRPVGDICIQDSHEVSIVIAKEYQNLHIGRRAMELLKEVAMERGHDRMTAQIYSFNAQSRKMFTHFGFRQVREEFFTYPLKSYEDVTIETPDIILKKGRSEDYFDIWQNLWRHPESARFMLWEPTFIEEEAKDRMERTIRFQEQEKYALFAYEKKTGKAIGFANMQEIGRGTYMEQGVALGPDYTGKGYGKQILNAMVERAFADGGEEFWSMCRVANVASHKVQMACGFTTDHVEEEETDPRTGETFAREINVRRKEVQSK